MYIYIYIYIYIYFLPTPRRHLQIFVLTPPYTQRGPLLNLHPCHHPVRGGAGVGDRRRGKLIRGKHRKAGSKLSETELNAAS